MTNLRLLYQQDDFPIFQNRMYDSAEDATQCPKGDIRLVEDLDTGLVYNAAFRPELMVYDSHYQNEQAVSPLFTQHLEAVASLIEQKMGREKLVEVGCGKAYFLEMLNARGFEITGFDPTYEGDNPCIQRQYFSPGITDRADGLILRHVLEHIQNPVSFLSQLRDANGGKGRIYIEVPCLDWICQHRAWFDIFYEHVNYFRLSDFNRIFGQVIESGKLFGGQYIYVIAELEQIQVPKIDMEDRPAFPADFTRGIGEPDPRMVSPLAIWGGASKGVIFALLKQRAGFPACTVIDINPAKQGKFLPGTGLEVKSPEAAMDAVPRESVLYVMNSNYLEEIKKMSNNAYQYVSVDND
jgi:hypothetical protein